MKQMESSHSTKIKPEIAIIDSNTLSCMGLKNILERIIPMAVIRTFCSFGQLIDDTPDYYFHYFVSAQIYFEHMHFFAPRKHKSIILATGISPQLKISGLHVLNICQPEEVLIKEILLLNRSAHEKGYPIKEDVSATQQTSPVSELTPREREVLILLVQGYINKEIADKLYISLTTVISHRKNITEKLGIKSISGLTIYAVMNGFIDADRI